MSESGQETFRHFFCLVLSCNTPQFYPMKMRTNSSAYNFPEYYEKVIFSMEILCAFFILYTNVIICALVAWSPVA